jgi:hypothetical protein
VLSRQAFLQFDCTAAVPQSDFHIAVSRESDPYQFDWMPTYAPNLDRLTEAFMGSDP